MDWRPVALALAVALAGCGSFVGGSGADGGRTATPTVSPVPVPTLSPTPGPTLPPGVTGSGVRNANALFGAHNELLADRSYTLTVRVRIDDTPSRRVVRVESPDRYYKRDRLGGYDRNITTFVAGGHVYLRHETANDTQYVRGTTTDRLGSPTIRLARVLMRVDDATVAETLVDGELHYAIRASSPEHPQVESFENFRVRAVASPEGLVRSMTASYTTSDATGTTNVTRSFAYTDVGSTTVDRPGWVTERWGPPGNGSRVTSEE